MAAAPNGLLAASPNVKVEVDEGVVVVVAPNDVVAAAAAFGCPKLNVDVEAGGAAVPKVAEAVVAAVALVLLALDPKENDGAPPALPKEKVGAAAADGVAAAAAVVAGVFPKEKDGVPLAFVAEGATPVSFAEPKENPPPAPPEEVFPKVNAEPDVAGAAEAAEVVAVDAAADVVPNENVGAADVKVVLVADVDFVCPKLNEGAAAGVAAAVFELLPNENDGWAGMDGVALAVVFALSEDAVEPNEKLTAGAAVAPASPFFPNVNVEPVVAATAGAEEVVIAPVDGEDVPNEKVEVAEAEVGFGTVVVAVFAWPKLKEGAAGVRPEVVAVGADGLLPPNENDGMAGAALVVVFALSEAADDPNETLAAGAAVSDLPKEKGGTEVACVETVLLADPGLFFGDAETEDAAVLAAGGAEVTFVSSSCFFSFSSDFFSTPNWNVAAFAFSGPFSTSASFSVLEVLSPKENVTFGEVEAASGAAFLESGSAVLEAPADFSAVDATLSAPSVTSFFFSPPSSPLTPSSFSSSASAAAAGGPSMTSLSSKVESKSATLCPMRLLSAS